MRPSGSNPPRGRRRRLGHSLSAGLEKRVASYATAARAAGVGSRARAPELTEVIARTASAVGAGLVLTAAPASARIVYTPAYTGIFASPSYNPVPVDLNHDGITDFRLNFFYAVRELALYVHPAQAGNAILGKIQTGHTSSGKTFTCQVASALPAGRPIGPGGRFGAYGLMFRDILCLPSYPSFCRNCGFWYGVQGRFLGFEFTVQGQKHFGWARLNMPFYPRSTLQAVLTGYAYETEPDKPIRAGERGPVADARQPDIQGAPPTVTALQPATLGLLAQGSAGLDIWRKEQDTVLGG